MEMEVTSPSPEAAVALRESFGDRKLPDISRKITACVACRKQKIKCHMNDGPPCTRCRKRGLSCTVNKSLQMLLENDVSWKTSMERRMRHMEATMAGLANGTRSGDLVRDYTQPRNPSSNSTQATPSSLDAPQKTWEVVLDPNKGPGAIPSHCVSEVPSTPSAAQRGMNEQNRCDLITQGVIPLSTAERYFSAYRDRLDHFVYNILADHDSLGSIRAKSPILVAVICAVSALHTAASDFEVCYQAFQDEFAKQIFAKEYSFDDVRALIIGAFWLSELSWNLVGAAVRIATQINLHRCITKIPHAKKACYTRTRLYFLVYICDHHFSVAYGRPPMTREFDSLSSPRAFLDSEFANEADARIVSQLEIWSISSRVHDTFGVDTEMTIPQRLLPQFRRLSIALDTWRADWEDRFTRNLFVGSYPQKGVGLHFHFAKLYLCSHVFRGPQSEPPAQLAAELEEFANAGISSACSIVRTIIVDEEIQSFLGGLPTYFDTMIAFSAVFLLKVTHKSPANIRINKDDILGLIEQLIIILTQVTMRTHTQHILYNIATSIGKLLERTRQALTTATGPQSTFAMLEHAVAPPEEQQDWLTSPSDPMFLGKYDFLWPQDTDLDFDFSNFDPMPAPT